MVTDLLHESAKIDMSAFIRSWHSTMDGRIAKWMHALTPPMIRLHLLKSGIVIPE